MPSVPSASQRLVHRLELAAVHGLIGVSRLMGPVAASNAVGALAAAIGPWLPASRTADRNLEHALPHLDAAGRGRIVRSVWNNLGRTVAELPHLASFKSTAAGPGWEVEGEHHVQELRRTGAPALFFSGHLDNWEMMLPIAATLGLNVSGFYRASSNPQVDAVILSLRASALNPQSRLFPKGAQGARQALAHLRQGHSLGLLADQKLNDGIPVPFFGRPAMTTPALGQMALRFELPIMPAYIVRLGPARFRLVFEAALTVARSGDRQADILAISLAINQTLERWIRERPGSWLWLHRRWPKAPVARV